MLRRFTGRNCQLRIWDADEGPVSALPGTLVVEWLGQAGHPTSYALLGGRLAEPGRIDVPQSGPTFDSLAQHRDQVTLGLIDEFRYADLAGLEITLAAQGEMGSSIVAFSIVAHVLRTLLDQGVPEDDAVLQQIVADALARYR